MKILALDTVSDFCSIALHINGDVVARELLVAQAHSEQLLPMISHLLADAGITLRELDAIAFDRGPGSFTGVRIGTSAAQALVYAHDLPVLPVSSLSCVAQQIFCTHPDYQHVAVALDARIREVYWGIYEKDSQGLPQLIGSECVCAPRDTALINKNNVFAAASGWQVYAAEFGHQLVFISQQDPACVPIARYLLPQAINDFRLGKTLSPDQALPVYLRDNVAEKSRV